MNSVMTISGIQSTPRWDVRTLPARYRNASRFALYLASEGSHGISAMTREEIIEKLRAMEPELRARGITRLQMFGSRARGDARPDSDLDLLVEYEKPRTASGWDFFGIGTDLTDELGIETNVVADHDGIKQRHRREMAPDLVTVF
jgi:predicted nucleotidyltransferase